jgi:hypothetical protein
MNKELTFNDLPMVVAQLRDEVVGMKQMIISLQSQNKPHKANTHIPMSVEEASAYLKMPMATLYMKLGTLTQGAIFKPFGHVIRKRSRKPFFLNPIS